MSAFTGIVVPIIACVGIGSIAGVYVTMLYRRNLRREDMAKRMQEEAKIVRVSASPMAPITVGRPKQTPAPLRSAASPVRINSTRDDPVDDYLTRQMLLYGALDNSATGQCTPSRHEPSFDSSSSSSCDSSSSSSSSYDSGSSSSGSFD